MITATASSSLSSLPSVCYHHHKPPSFQRRSDSHILHYTAVTSRCICKLSAVNAFSLFPLSANCRPSTSLIVSHCPGNVGHRELFSQMLMVRCRRGSRVIYRTMRGNHLFVADPFRSTCVALLSLASPGQKHKGIRGTAVFWELSVKSEMHIGSEPASDL